MISFNTGMNSVTRMLSLVTGADEVIGVMIDRFLRDECEKSVAIRW